MTTAAIGVAVTSAGTSFLFVPGDRPERFTKAASSSADVVIIDLEDAVSPGQYNAALLNVVQALTGGMRALVRIHPSTSLLHGEQLAALQACEGTGLLGVIVAKAEDADAVRNVRAALSSDLAVIPLIESALGILRAHELASIEGVTRLAFGAVDYSLDINADPQPDVLAYARSYLVVASRAASIPAPLDSPPMDIADQEAVAAAALRARRFGFGGMLLIHPSQLGPIREGFLPTSAEIQWAHSVLDVEGGAVQLDGKLVDRPVTERARLILARAEK